MPYGISTLLTRNLQEVFGENDPVRRRAAVQELYTEDGVFYDPSKGVYRGRDEIDRIAGEIRATHFDFRYEPIAEPEETGNGGRVRWAAGRPGEAPLTPELISSLPAMAGLPPFISFSTSYPELNFAAPRKLQRSGTLGTVFVPKSTPKAAIFQIGGICGPIERSYSICKSPNGM
jgi:hypothetical protein